MKNIILLPISNLFNIFLPGIFLIFVANQGKGSLYEMFSFNYTFGISLSIFLSFGLAKSMVLLYSKDKLIWEKMDNIYTSIIFNLSIFFGILFLIFQKIYFLFGIVEISILLITHIFISKKQYTKYFAYIVVTRGCKIISCVEVILSNDEILDLSILNIWAIIGIGINFMVLLTLNRKLKFFQYKDIMKHFKINETFIIPIYAQDVLTISRSNLDKILIAEIWGINLMGQYYFSYQIFTLLTILPNLYVTFRLSMKIESESEIRYLKFIRYILIIMTTLGVVLLWINIEIVLSLFFPIFLNTVDTIKLMSIGALFSMVLQFEIAEFLSLKKSSDVFNAYLLGVIIYYILLIFLGNYLSLIGLGYALIFSNIIILITLLLKGNKKII